jgi:hypothetical protein
MAITFQDSFTELIRRAIARLAARKAFPRTFRRDQVLAWLQARLSRRTP